ncbi:uridylate kinase [Mycoplasmopsis californica]|uniref:Uridylate kinase n=1 Tax=Mycoplasmopsis equigenitalium TaxID=114883 RepID=A0ABY5J4G0_9BACT|nr:UMP kinase [Mycoplasmopsis equigenitalium]UUD36771.1 UMP kinase [Mycoplasmopsis equigenitalium]VEU69931.1 uridylate kinase [Mycoplasmopsis californica]
MKNKRILLKLSGEGLANKDKNLLIDYDLIDNIAKQLIAIKKQHKLEIAIVIGGGNLFRGASAAKSGMGRTQADYIGMLATIMNGKAIQDGFERNNLKTKVLSSLAMDPKVCETYTTEKAKEYLNAGETVVFVGGTGRPFFTTDTASTLFASEINADLILMGKNQVDGVFDSDPKTNLNAKHFTKITYDEILKQKLQVMDLTATSMARDNNLKLIVFDITKENAIVKAINKDIKTTEVTN